MLYENNEVKCSKAKSPSHNYPMNSILRRNSRSLHPNKGFYTDREKVTNHKNLRSPGQNKQMTGKNFAKRAKSRSEHIPSAIPEKSKTKNKDIYKVEISKDDLMSDSNHLSNKQLEKVEVDLWKAQKDFIKSQK
jgi:hypothetical protein